MVRSQDLPKPIMMWGSFTGALSRPGLIEPDCIHPESVHWLFRGIKVQDIDTPKLDSGGKDVSTFQATNS